MAFGWLREFFRKKAPREKFLASARTNKQLQDDIRDAFLQINKITGMIHEFITLIPNYTTNVLEFNDILEKHGYDVRLNPIVVAPRERDYEREAVRAYRKSKWDRVLKARDAFVNTLTHLVKIPDQYRSPSGVPEKARFATVLARQHQEFAAAVLEGIQEIRALLTTHYRDILRAEEFNAAYTVLDRAIIRELAVLESVIAKIEELERRF